MKEKNSNNLDYWKITISDTGVGIAENLKDKIFEPFFTTKEAFYGSGIGLSTVKMIVQDHNGIIEFESKEGAGTSFFIYLPILKIEKFLEPVAFDGSVKKGSGLILVVDDEKLVRTITKTMLIKLGYSALIASNSEEAIMIFKKNMQSIKLIILDIAIPGKSGIEIIREIKKIKFTTKVLLISGLKVEENMSKIIENAADGFLPKPFTISELSNSVFNIIYKKNQN